MERARNFLHRLRYRRRVIQEDPEVVLPNQIIRVGRARVEKRKIVGAILGAVGIIFVANEIQKRRPKS